MKTGNRDILIVKILLFSAAFSLFPVYSQDSSSTASAALVQGYEAYKKNDWTTAMFMLRKASAYPEYATEETWYMLVMAEMYSGEYKNSISDCDYFMSHFTASRYYPYIEYQSGRALFYLGEYEKAVLRLSDFCHQYPGHEMYASALYWIAESFFAGYDYDSAKALYERIVTDFPSDSKVPMAQYRIESIAQRSREEKLLYLLKVTGEEYLSAKEDYERQLKQYQAENTNNMREQLAAAQTQNEQLTAELADAQKQIQELQKQLEDLESYKAGMTSDIESLKLKAKEVQELLNMKEEGSNE